MAACTEVSLNAEIYKTLDEVVVTANQELFKTKGANRYVYEVYKDSTLTGANTLEALSRVPLLAVTKTGSMQSMTGRELKFKINGLNDPLLKSLSQALTAIPAAVIKVIEFKEDFSGVGIPILEVNIVTKGRLEGCRVQVESKIADSQWENSIWALSKIKRLTFQGGYTNRWIWGHTSSSGSDEVRYDSSDAYRYISEKHEDGYKTDMHDMFVTASYDVDDRSFLNLFGRVILKSNPHSRSHEKNNLYNEGGVLVASYDNEYYSKLRDAEYDASLKYERDLTSGNLPGSFNVGYEFYSRPINHCSTYIYDIKDNNMGSGLDFLDIMDSYRTRHQRYITNTIAADWTKETSANTQWSVYGKLRTRNEGYDNDLLMQSVTGERNPFSEHSSTSLSEYWGSVTPKFSYYRNDKWEVRGGFVSQFYLHKIKTSDREENIINRHVSILPFISAGILANRSVTIRVAYSMSEKVPDITALNPYVIRTEAGQISYGNPKLKPQTSHNIGLGVNGRIGKLYTGGTLNAYYKKDLCLRYSFVEEGIMNNTYGNIANSRGVSLGGYTSGRVHRNTYLRFSASVDWVQYRASLLNQTNAGWCATCRGYIEQDLPWDLTLSAEAGYSTPSVMLQGRSGHSFNYGINLYRQFLNRNLTVIVDANSFVPIWYTLRSSSFGPSFSSSSWYRSFHASFSLTLRYTFGNLKAKVRSAGARLDNPDIKSSYSD